jgi:hypothetical protein
MHIFVGAEICWREHKFEFQVLTAASMKMTAFWDTEPRSLVKVERQGSTRL